MWRARSGPLGNRCIYMSLENLIWMKVDLDRPDLNLDLPCSSGHTHVTAQLQNKQREGCKTTFSSQQANTDREHVMSAQAHGVIRYLHRCCPRGHERSGNLGDHCQLCFGCLCYLLWLLCSGLLILQE